MNYFANINNLYDLKREYRRLAKLLHPDINPDEDGTNFKVMVEQYAVAQQSIIYATEPVDLHAPARVLSTILTEALTGVYKFPINLVLMVDTVLVCFSWEAGMKKIMDIKELCENLADKLQNGCKVSINVELPEKDTEMKMDGDWIFLTAGPNIPKSLGKATTMFEDKGKYYMGNAKYSWCLDISKHKTFVAQTSTDTLKKMMNKR